MIDCVINDIVISSRGGLKIDSNFDRYNHVDGYGVELRLYIEPSYGPCGFYIIALKDFCGVLNE